MTSCSWGIRTGAVTIGAAGLHERPQWKTEPSVQRASVASSAHVRERSACWTENGSGVGLGVGADRPQHSSAPHAKTSKSGCHEGSLATPRHRLQTRARVRSIVKGSCEKTCCSTSWSKASSPPHRNGMKEGRRALLRAWLPAGSQMVCCTRCRNSRVE
eukprot:scaffold17717_cov112-Isochrysis_galbana.AAC.9